MTTPARFTIAAATAFGIATAAFAGSHGGAPAEVKARQAHMQLYLFNAGVLFGMAQGKVDYDSATAVTAASNLAALARLDESRYWVEGTDSESIEGTRALPGLFAETSTAMTKMADLASAADAMAAVAGDGLEAVQANIGAIGGVCTACHEKYRAPAN